MNKKQFKIIFTLLTGTLLFFLSSCNQEDPKPDALPKTKGILTLQFSNTFDGSSLTKNSATYYTNAAGNEFNVSTFRYYISNVELTKLDGSKVLYPVYKLIDAFDESTQTISLLEVPNGDYKAISYFIGIDSARNHSGPQEGDLSATTGMLWTWASGYLFLKLEGFYKNGTSQTSFRYHIGTDELLNKVTSPINYSIQGNQKNAFLVCNLAEFFKNPTTFDIKLDDDIQSFPNEKKEASELAANMADMITVLKIE
jgi:hypothetical protein